MFAVVELHKLIVHVVMQCKHKNARQLKPIMEIHEYVAQLARIINA